MLFTRGKAVKQFFRLIVTAIFLTGGMAEAANLTVEVVGTKNAKGKILVAVYNRAEDFLKHPMRTAAVDAQPGKVQIVISDLLPGDYALSVFQDENGNGELDTNPIGMPIESYGFSKDASGSFGPPNFEVSLIHLPEAGNQITIKLR